MKSILLIGLGRFGYHVARELNKLDVEILAVDKNELYLKQVAEFVEKAIIGDSCDREFLETLGVSNFDECIVSIGDDFQGSLETVLNLKELGAKKITARASKESQEKLLKRIGVDVVVYPEKQLAKWTALHCGTNSIYDFMELDSGYGIYEVAVPESWEGKTLLELDLRKKYNINIIGVKVNNKLKVVLAPDFELKKDESLLVVATDKDLKTCFNI